MRGEDGLAFTHGDVQEKVLVMIEAEIEAMCLQEPGSQPGLHGYVKTQETGPVLRSGPADSSAFHSSPICGKKHTPVVLRCAVPGSCSSSLRKPMLWEHCHIA